MDEPQAEKVITIKSEQIRRYTCRFCSPRTAPDAAIGVATTFIGAEQPDAQAPAAKPETADAPRAAKTAFDPSKYRISSIVVGAAGGMALVNGRPVRVGDTLGGATVMAIAARTVEVECGGQRWTLRM